MKKVRFFLKLLSLGSLSQLLLLMPILLIQISRSVICKKFTAYFVNINVITVAPPNYKSYEPVCQHNWRALSILSVRYYQVRGTLPLGDGDPLCNIINAVICTSPSSPSLKVETTEAFY